MRVKEEEEMLDGRRRERASLMHKLHGWSDFLGGMH